MKLKRRYLVAVALLAVLAVAFGLAGTTATVSKPDSPQSSSPSDPVAHFQNPPTYNSSWLDITDKAGQCFNVTHNLNSTEIIVDITGKTTPDGGTHQEHLGGTGYTSGWNQTYGGADNDIAHYVIQTSDDGYAIVGYTYSFGAGGQDLWLVKTDSAGNVQWNQTYGGANNDGSSARISLVQTGDGGYAIASNTLSFGAGGQDFWLIKTDSYGNVQWNSTYGGSNDDYAWSLVETSDGGYAIVGGTLSLGAGGYDMWLVKTNATGNIQWSQTYGGSSNDWGYSLVQIDDGGYAMAGSTYSYGAGGMDVWLVKTNSSGSMQWSQTYGGTGSETAFSLIQSVEGGYAMAGIKRVGGSWDIWLVKTNASGNTQWSRTYGGANDDWSNSLVRIGDGGYAIAGFTMSFGAGDHDIWLLRTDASGNTQWDRTCGGTGYEDGNCIVSTDDGGYAVAGGTSSSGAGGHDFWLIKTDEVGNAHPSFKFGLAWTDSAADDITLYRGTTDPFWNYVRVRIWTIQEPTWQFGDINQDGVVDAQDLLILSQNYGKTLSLLSLGGIIGILGIQTYKTRKRPE